LKAGDAFTFDYIIARIRQGTRTNARTALDRARARIAAQADDVEQVLVGLCRPAAPLPDEPDPAVSAALDALVEQLAATRFDVPAAASTSDPTRAAPTEAIPIQRATRRRDELRVPPAPVWWRLVVAGGARSGRSSLIDALRADGPPLPALGVEIVELDSGARPDTLQQASGVIVVLSSRALLDAGDRRLLRSLSRTTPTMVVVNVFAADLPSGSRLAEVVWRRVVQEEWGGPPWSAAADLAAYSVHLVDVAAGRHGLRVGDRSLVERSGLAAVSAVLRAEIGRRTSVPVGAAR
jgi:hypothetical protein